MKVGDDDEGGWIIFKKGGVGNIEGSSKNKGVRSPLPDISHKELSWKKAVLVV